ncbi:class I SAM-dependent methyltransferase [Paracidovorax cattleyae]|uniref:Methyltransferase domain-containing protein n=1 Tax=Paracidovorax cattleyae TaxID=80868 RepID=A0A1H0P774_9BURK|nr:class I SAM-dependent methyltransferase [Paracidovorax cattleyae]AVS76094.1 class I SAM-dependent methyltransferase [Paracidovorax cattleyae]MBF9264625.1 class I SAM-dependent methyltransferase [Paracidovorax cattleyae]SDP00784.1 Methyltransferase domain-containing protein [Paracidovorax cattleyae]
MGYYQNFNSTVLNLVEERALDFCEFGCGAGALAEAVKNKIPHARYTGVDIAAEPLAQARHVLDNAVLLNLDNCPNWEENSQLLACRPAGGFDCIIFGDVLEHLYAPEKSVDQAANWLRPGGCLIASVPNVQHWSVFLQLVRGSWPREDMGIFDRTHIRWFTLADLHALFDHPSLSIEAVVPRIFQEEQGREIAEFMEPLAMHQGVDPEQLTNMMLPLQYVFKVRKV